MKSNYLFRLTTTLSLMIIYATYTQAALAEDCPVKRKPDTSLEVINGASSDPEKIYFCKQEFTIGNRTFQPTSTDMIPGGSQAISKPNTIQVTPLSNSIDLSGFTINDLQFRTSISKTMPNDTNKPYPKSLFNFYTYLDNKKGEKCYKQQNGSNQYNKMLKYLRNNASTIFSANGKVATSNFDVDKIATISDAVLTNINNRQLKADITLEYVNNSNSGQFFTELGVINNVRGVMCWVGVGATFTLKPDSSLKEAGEYNVILSVN